MNASPDLPWQIQATPALQPTSDSPRNTPIAGVLLTNADLDHVLGLFCLREGGPLEVHATDGVRQTLATCLGLDGILGMFCGIAWHVPPCDGFVPLETLDGKPTLLYRAISLAGRPPPFARGTAVPGEHSIAYQFLDPQSGKRLLVAPDVGALNEGLSEALTTSEWILFDGTFWSTNELLGVKPSAPMANEMGHVTIKDCSLDLLQKMPAGQKIYIHINNTNPILSPGSPERAEVEAAGIIVAVDGFEFEI